MSNIDIPREINDPDGLGAQDNHDAGYSENRRPILAPGQEPCFCLTRAIISENKETRAKHYAENGSPSTYGIMITMFPNKDKKETLKVAENVKKYRPRGGNPSLKKVVAIVLMALALLAIGIHAQEQGLTRYESQIERYEQLDRESPPKEGGIVFAGSSTFVMWKTMVEDLKPLPVLNRGFGGSTFPELIHYAGRIIIPYRPKIVVVYEGDNDLSGPDADATAVFKNFRLLETKIHDALPDTMLYFLSIKPSIARWNRWEEMRKANRMIADFVKGKKGLGYIDIVPAILDDEGKPRKYLFADDHLHLNAEGYRRITNEIRDRLIY